MNQPIIVDQAKHREVREAKDFMKKYRDFGFCSMPEEEFLGNDKGLRAEFQNHKLIHCRV